MMNNQFLILLGAGSSCGYGFPLWKQVSELLHIEFVEVEKMNHGFSGSINVDIELWKSNFALVKQCVRDVDHGAYNTIDEAVTEYCKKVEHSKIFRRVFWFTMARTFINLINYEGNSGPPLTMVPHQYGEYSPINSDSLETFHIHYLFVKHELLARQLKTAIFVDYNYDGLFEHCYRYEYFDGEITHEGAKILLDIHLHKLKQKELEINRQSIKIEQLEASKVAPKPKPRPKYPDQYLLNKERFKKRLGIKNSHDSIVVEPRKDPGPIGPIRKAIDAIITDMEGQQ